MPIADLHPVLPLLLGAILTPLLGLPGRRALSLLAPAAALACWILAPADARLAFTALDYEWILLRSDGLSRVFALAFIVYSLIAGVYAWTDTGRVPKTAALFLASSGVGIAYAGDLFTLYVFWEMGTLGSLFLIWFGAGREAIRAGFRYLMMHMFGGVCLLSGALILVSAGSGAMEALDAGTLAGRLVLFGVLVNAAVPPLHAWLSDAYPRASVYGTVFLAAFTTKSAVYVLARLFPGTELLVWAGAAMALYGVVFAVLENDIRRLLAYHIVSQVGYMVCGVGLGTALALNGATAHAFSHIFYKGLLLMSAGAVIHATGKGKLTELGGLPKSMRLTLLFCMIGAFSISGVPLFNGFVSKSMVVSAAAYSHRGPIELMLLLASMGTFLHTGLKVPWFTFLGDNHGARVIRAVPRSMYLAMGIAAFICIATGVAPGLLYALLPFDAEYLPYTADHVVGALQLLVGTALGFWFLRGKLGGQATVTLDVDRLYRRPLAATVAAFGWALDLTGRECHAATTAVLRSVWDALEWAQRRMRMSTLSAQSAVTWIALAGTMALLLLLAR